MGRRIRALALLAVLAPAALAPASALADGYLLVLGGIADPGRRDAHEAALPAALAAAGGTRLAAGGPARGVEWLRGDGPARGASLSGFASPDDARAFWTSDANPTAAALREGAGRFDALLLDGAAPGRPGGAYLVQLTTADAPPLPAPAVEGAARVLVDGAPVAALAGDLPWTRALVLEFAGGDALDLWWQGHGGFLLQARARGRPQAVIRIAGNG